MRSDPEGARIVSRDGEDGVVGKAVRFAKGPEFSIFKPDKAAAVGSDPQRSVPVLIERQNGVAREPASGV